jgi:hypothetical protein
MAIHMGDPFSMSGNQYEGRWPKRVHPDPADSDRFVCDGCHKKFDIDDSIKPLGKKGPMLCPGCAGDPAMQLTPETRPVTPADWDRAASDSTNMSLFENKAIQPEDL